MGTQVATMARFMLWAPSVRAWGTQEELLDYKEFLSIPQSEAIGKK